MLESSSAALALAVREGMRRAAAAFEQQQASSSRPRQSQETGARATASPVSSYRDRVALDDRRREARAMRAKHAGRVPVIIEPRRNGGGGVAPPIQLPNCKYLVPADLSVGQFMYVLRRRASLAPERALFVFVGGDRGGKGGVLPPAGNLLGDVHAEHADVEDGFLYMTYAEENTFGGC